MGRRASRDPRSNRVTLRELGFRLVNFKRPAELVAFAHPESRIQAHIPRIPRRLLDARRVKPSPHDKNLFFDDRAPFSRGYQRLFDSAIRFDDTDAWRHARADDAGRDARKPMRCIATGCRIFTNPRVIVPLRSCQAFPQAKHPEQDARGRQGRRVRDCGARISDRRSSRVGRSKSSVRNTSSPVLTSSRTPPRTSRSSVSPLATFSWPFVAMKSSIP